MGEGRGRGNAAAIKEIDSRCTSGIGTEIIHGNELFRTARPVASSTRFKIRSDVVQTTGGQRRFRGRNRITRRIFERARPDAKNASDCRLAGRISSFRALRARRTRNARISTGKSFRFRRISTRYGYGDFHLFVRPSSQKSCLNSTRRVLLNCGVHRRLRDEH